MIETTGFTQNFYVYECLAMDSGRLDVQMPHCSCDRNTERPAVFRTISELGLSCSKQSPSVSFAQVRMRTATV